MLRPVVNKIRCKSCGDIIESRSVHDFVTCRCNKCFVDGGTEYARHGFEGDNANDAFEDMSIYFDTETEQYIKAANADAKKIFTGPKEDDKIKGHRLKDGEAEFWEDTRTPLMPEDAVKSSVPVIKVPETKKAESEKKTERPILKVEEEKPVIKQIPQKTAQTTRPFKKD